MCLEMPAEFIRLPTNRNTGTATSGNESSAYSVRCAIRSSGRSLSSMYRALGIPIASTTGKPSRNSVRKAATTRKPPMSVLDLHQVSTVCFSVGRLRCQVCTNLTAVSSTISAALSASGAMKSQNGISSVAVRLFMLLRMV